MDKKIIELYSYDSLTMDDIKVLDQKLKELDQFGFTLDNISMCIGNCVDTTDHYNMKLRQKR